MLAAASVPVVSQTGLAGQQVASANDDTGDVNGFHRNALALTATACYFARATGVPRRKELSVGVQGRRARHQDLPKALPTRAPAHARAASLADTHYGRGRAINLSLRLLKQM